jgi:hypothetical protein
LKKTINTIANHEPWKAIYVLALPSSTSPSRAEQVSELFHLLSPTGLPFVSKLDVVGNDDPTLVAFPIGSTVLDMPCLAPALLLYSQQEGDSILPALAEFNMYPWMGAGQQ